MRICFFLILFSVFVLSACVNRVEPTLPQENEAQSYVTEVVQLVPSNGEQSLSALLEIFGKRGLTVTALDPAAKSFVTGWISTDSEACRQYLRYLQPVECQLRYIARIREQLDKQSAVTIRYRLHCSTEEKKEVYCPAPSAETDLENITEELRTALSL